MNKTSSVLSWNSKNLTLNLLTAGLAVILFERSENLRTRPNWSQPGGTDSSILQ